MSVSYLTSDVPSTIVVIIGGSLVVYMLLWGIRDAISAALEHYNRKVGTP